MTLQLALAGFAEYVLHLTRLNPDILYLHQVCCFFRFYPQGRQSAKLFLQSSVLGLPHPSIAGKCAVCSGGGGAHSLAGEGVGESQFRRGTYTVVLYLRVYMFFVFLPMQYAICKR
jgi:hypothetical protein